jgi:NAD(P)-dependent dehydrogenase (short-subunit alcohol dehydrogenase family)
MEGLGCLIVGGTGGIGLATASRMLEEGARVVVSGLTDEDVATAHRVLDAHLPSLRALVADVASVNSVSGLFADAVEWLDGRLDVLIHVAGISGRRFGDGPLHACTDEGWDRVQEVNARGAFLTNRAAVRQMLAQEVSPETGTRGVVVNVGSVLAHAPSPRHFGTIAYAASKGALRAMTFAAASAYAAEKVRFNLVEPALIETPMSRRAVEDPVIAAFLAEKQPLGGGPGRPEDVAAAVLSLAEPAARFLTGAVLAVDGGWCVSGA